MPVVDVVQVQIGTHSFTFDHVYGSTGSPSSAMFEECIAPLVDGLFQGYNATVLAYGQVKFSQATLTCFSIPFTLRLTFSTCCRRVLVKHIPWAQASEMVAKQE